MAAQPLRPGADLETIRGEVNALLAAGASDPLAVHGAAALRVVRGRVGSGGALVSGEGFTSAVGATGVYTVTLTTPFAVAPTVVASLDGGGRVCSVAPAVGSFVVTVLDSATQLATSSPFSFIAIGAA